MTGRRPRDDEVRSSAFALGAKRAFDVVFSVAVLVLSGPLFGVAAALIKLGSRGPVFFRQERVGRGGKPFFIYKFRTMVSDAPALGPGITAAGDPRVTRVGHLLRVTKLDELPNFVNVLRGEMSVVGPRPDLPRFMTTLTAEQRRLLDFRPGITGPTQIRYIAEEEMLSPVNIDDNYVENVLRDKIVSDLDYVTRWTFGRDALFILYTVVALVFKLMGRMTRTFRLTRPAPRRGASL